MVQLVLEANNLVLELDDFTLAVYELRLLVLQIKGLSINELVEIINSGQLLADIALQ